MTRPTACLVCGDPMEARRSTRRYCSVACRIESFRVRHGADHTTRDRAHKAVQKAVTSGQLERTPCAECGASGRVEGHHHNGYGEAAVLDVVFLCSKHHKAAHRKLALPNDPGEAAPAVGRHSTPETAASLPAPAPLTTVAPPRLPLPIEVCHVPGEWLSNGYPSGIGGRTTYHVGGRSFDTPREALDYAGRR